MAFHSAVDIEKLPLDSAAYRIAEDIRYYQQLGGFKQEHYKTIQQICMLNAIPASKQATLMTLIDCRAWIQRLQLEVDYPSYVSSC
jgi:hypothetical protein